MVLGLRGPGGGPCKSEDTTGWGLSRYYGKTLIVTMVLAIDITDIIHNCGNIASPSKLQCCEMKFIYIFLVAPETWRRSHRKYFRSWMQRYT